jgi:hypothetical protein
VHHFPAHPLIELGVIGNQPAELLAPWGCARWAHGLHDGDERSKLRLNFKYFWAFAVAVRTGG